MRFLGELQKVHIEIIPLNPTTPGVIEPVTDSDQVRLNNLNAGIQSHWPAQCPIRQMSAPASGRLIAKTLEHNGCGEFIYSRVIRT